MKALSLAQPYATLVAIGAKRVETRSWSTSYRGLLAIHASARIPKANIGECWKPPFRAVLEKAGYLANSGPSGNPFSLPLGAVLAIVTLLDVQRITPENIPAEPEYSFGDYDYTTRRYAWYLAKVYRLPSPVEAKGKLGLWEWVDTASADEKVLT
jgi:hypothetical protein